MDANPLPPILPDPDSLYTPDHPFWQIHPGYNRIAAAKIIEAYRLIATASGYSANYLTAARLALECLDGDLCECQRLRALWVVAQGRAARDHDDDFDEGVGWVDEALYQTQRVPEHPSFIDLVDMRANLNVRRIEFGAASDDFDETLARLRALPQPWDQKTVIQMMATLTFHAQVRFYLSDAERVQQLLREARELVPLAGECELQVAGIEMVQALLSRQLGKAAEAAPIALRAAESLEHLKQPQSAVRAHVLLAGIYLDMTEKIPDSRDRDNYFANATSHLTTARKLAKACDDEKGAALVTLEHVRLDRLRGRWQDRLKIIQREIDGARLDNNMLLLVQALTTLGDEYRWLGKPGTAKATYRQALAELGNHEITALAAPIRKALETLD